MVQPVWKFGAVSHTKISRYLYDPAIPLLGIKSRELNIFIHKDWYVNVHNSFIS